MRRAARGGGPWGEERSLGTGDVREECVRAGERKPKQKKQKQKAETKQSEKQNQQQKQKAEAKSKHTDAHREEGRDEDEGRERMRAARGGEEPGGRGNARGVCESRRA